MIINVFGSTVCFADSVYLSQMRHTTGHCRSDKFGFVRVNKKLILNVHFIILHKSLFDLMMALDSSFKLKLSNSLMSST